MAVVAVDGPSRPRTEGEGVGRLYDCRYIVVCMRYGQYERVFK